MSVPILGQRPKIGVDFHGVIGQLDVAWGQYFYSKHPEHSLYELTHPDAYEFYQRICLECRNHCQKDGELLASIPPVPGSLWGLRLASKWASLFLISSPVGIDPQHTEDWLKAKGVDHLFVKRIFTENKTAACRENGLDALIDDSPVNLEPLFNTPTEPIIFDKPYNRHVQGRVRVRSWAEILAVLQYVVQQRQQREQQIGLVRV